MRQAIVEIIGSLITELANINGGEQTDPKQNQKQISGLFQLLLDRVLDNSSYVRSKVFAVLAKLVNIKTYKFPKHRLQITTTTVSALDDKNSSVRKAAASLLVQLLFTHPYILHGGMLQREIWENEYKEAVTALDKIEGAMGKAVEDNGEQGQGEEKVQKKSRKKKSKRSLKFFRFVLPILNR
jgi:condensin complex subunit 1